MLPGDHCNLAFQFVALLKEGGEEGEGGHEEVIN